MRYMIAAVLALAVSTPLFAASVVALGVGASSASEVVVKIDGKDTTVKLAGAPAEGTYPAQAFLQCLVAERVMRVDRASGRVMLLDGTSVADHLAEFLQTRTLSDPCMLGKAAYVHATPRTAAAPAAAPAATPIAVTPLKGAREGHVSFASGSSAVPTLGAAAPSPAQPKPATAAPASPYANVPPPLGQAARPGIYSPPTVGTTTLTPVGSQQSMGTVGTYTPQPAQTTTIPTTSTVPIITTSTQPPQ